MLTGWLWAIFTVAAAGGQTLRNVMQRGLIDTVGTFGATMVRFLYGLPFAALILAGVLAVTGGPLLLPDLTGMLWVVFGALTQIIATALLLAAMREKSFVLITALNKIEPVHVALFGLMFLGDKLSWQLAGAIGIATLGVLVMSWPRKAAAAPKTAAAVAPPLAPGSRPLVFDAASGRWRGEIVVDGQPMEYWLPGSPQPGPAQSAFVAPTPGLGLRPIALGLVAGAMFGASAVGYRGAILSLAHPNFVVGATTILVTGLLVQVIAQSLYLLIFNRQTLVALAKAWRPSLIAGFMGAFASSMWFCAFALESAAKVRTLGLVEIFFAGLVSRNLFKQGLASREGVGILLIVIGVIGLLNL